MNQERSLAIQREAGFRSLKNREVRTSISHRLKGFSTVCLSGKKHGYKITITMNDQVTGAGRKKKARMAGTRSDFLTRACSTEVDPNEDEDDEYEYRPVLSRTRTLPESLGSLEPVFDSDSEMVKLIPHCKK